MVSPVGEPLTTAALATRVADLAVLLERRHPPEHARDFLIRCVFTLFAADLGLLPPGLLPPLLADDPRRLADLWTCMHDGRALDGRPIRRFGGELLRDAAPLDLTADERVALRDLGACPWRAVSPAILGTLLERALSPGRRRRLGAHYTPVAYIERIVERTLAEPLRADRSAMSATEFRGHLARVRVLDPACGSGNFLVVALAALMRLDDDAAVHPTQLHGLELDPAAARIAALTLWIGFLQRQAAAGRLARTPEPLLADLPNIRTADALLTHAGGEDLLDARGHPVLRARGVTDKRDTRHLAPAQQLRDVAVTPWPSVDFIVGNPPFIGNKRIPDVLGPDHAAALRAAYPAVPGSADLVMYWWWRSAELLRVGRLRRFGLVTTNSITQRFNRAVVERALADGVRLVYAIPDHPWFDAGAAVRIAVTIAGDGPPELGAIVEESRTGATNLELVRVADTPVAQIHADLTAGPDLQHARPLRANAGLSFQGITLVGEGFRLTRDDLTRLGIDLETSTIIKPYLIGRDLVRRPEERWVVDLHGLSQETAAARHPTVLEHLARTVKPQREAQNDRRRREQWWQFGRSGADLRAALAGLRRYIATARTARHRVFVFVPAATLPDTKIVAIASEDPAMLAVLSSRVHRVWSLRMGGRLGAGNDPTYNHLDCFVKFPLPALTPDLRRLGERLDEHRKSRQARHPGLTLTAIYNALNTLRAGEALTDREHRTCERADLPALRDLHDELDRQTLVAYGWPDDHRDDAVIAGLLALNAERAAAEATRRAHA